jgi:hypothetical protein
LEVGEQNGFDSKKQEKIKEIKRQNKIYGMGKSRTA